jgi:hypothetical protein
VVSGKSCNTQSRDLVLQLVERYEIRNFAMSIYLFILSFFFSSIFVNLCLFDCRILSTPKARQVLVNSAVRKGERLIPPSAFEILIRVTFPASSAKMKVVTLGTFTVSEVRCIMITCCIVS